MNKNDENEYKPKHESYVVGQEYIDDKNEIEVVIKWAFKLPCIVTDFNIDDHPFHVRQSNNKINFNLNKKISKKLFNDLKNTKPEASQFIASYIYDIIPRANKELLKRKYMDAHVLLRTFSMFEIEDVFIVNKKGEYIPILWPLPIPPFPPLKNKTKALEHVFIRDLVDAMTYYFSYNFDECIRKIITSLENYFIYYDIKPPRNKRINNLKSFFDYILNRRNIKFSKQVKYYIVEKNYSYNEKHLQVLRDNIMFIYFLRNKIVHDQLRFRLENEMVCKKGIGTLLYIYQSKQNVRKKLFDYIFSLDMQFKMISDNLLWMNLDWIQRAERNAKKEKNVDNKIIKNKEDMDNWIFGSLKITKKQKRQATKST